MQYCPKCEVHIMGYKQCCPLCQGALTGEPSPSPFPVLKKAKISRFSLFKVSTFAMIVTEIVISALAVLSDQLSGWMSLTMILALVAWADVWIVQYYRNSPLMLISLEAYVSMLICLSIDAKYTGLNWSLPYVIPVLFIVMIALLIIIARFMRLTLEEYVMYLVFAVLLCLFQLVPVLRHVNPHPLLAVVSVGMVLVLAAAVIIFHPKDLRSASGKWFRLK